MPAVPVTVVTRSVGDSTAGRETCESVGGKTEDAGPAGELMGTVAESLSNSAAAFKDGSTAE